MKILHDETISTVLYKYKGQTYETPPIKHYYVEMEEISGTIKYISIHKKIPNYIHAMILILFLVPLIVLNYLSSQVETVQIREHTLRIPSEMYYDSRTKVLDLDVTNDESNFEVISFSIESPSGETILELNGISPGESVGSIPIDFKFDSLPAKCKLIYRATYNGYVFKDLRKDILIVDRSIADKDANRDF